VTAAVAATDRVVTLNVAVVFPAATTTEAGTVAEELLLARVTVKPPDGAAPLNVMVPVADVPLVTLDGLIEIEESEVVAAGVIVRAVVLLTLL
jgi:hypothetical protein